MIDRILRSSLLEAAQSYPVVTLTGPRQSGKTTLCRLAFPHLPLVTLEDPALRAFARDDARGFLAQFSDGVVIDEVQRVPDLPSYLQGIVDEDPRPGRFILTGSQNFSLIASLTQSLAGRTALLTLLPCSLEEVRAFDDHPNDLLTTLLYGGYPRILDRGLTPSQWFRDYVATYLERDVRQILNIANLADFQTFLGLCAGRSGQLLNLSGLGADTGITHATAKAWTTVLEASYIAFRLRPYHRNFRKRLVRSPKLYFYDSGLLCYLLGIETPQQLKSHPLRGAIFETWVAAEIHKARWHRNATGTVSFYRDHKGHEVDFVIEQAGHVKAVECKSGQTVASDFFDGLYRFADLVDSDESVLGHQEVVIYGGNETQRRTRGVAVPWSRIQEERWVLS